VVIGHNELIAWGLTNLAADVTDLYVDKVEGQRAAEGDRRRRSRLAEAGRVSLLSRCAGGQIHPSSGANSVQPYATPWPCCRHSRTPTPHRRSSSVSDEITLYAPRTL
jgi:hypothetical protein